MLSTVGFWVRRGGRGLLAWSLGVGVMVVAVAAAYLAEAETPADAARFAASLNAFALAVKPLFGEPISLDTAGGFVHWRILGPLPLIVGAYLIVFVSRMTVGEERRGAVDLVLSTPLARVRFMLERFAALAIIALGIGLAGLVLGALGSGVLGAPFSLADGVFAGLGLGLLLLVWASLTGLVAQFTLSRAVAGAVSALLMVVVHLLSNVSGVVGGLEDVGRVLPTRAYSASRPLIPGAGPDAGSLLILGAEAVLLWGVATVLFARRDMNVARSGARRRAAAPLGTEASTRSDAARESAAAAVPGGRQRVSGSSRWASVMLRGPLTRDVWALKGVALGWAVGLSALVAFLVSVEPTLRSPLEEMLDQAGPLARLFAGDLTAPGALVGLMFGLFLAPAIAAFAVLQAGRWAGEMEEGLLVLDLSTALGRIRLLLSRVAAVLLAGGEVLVVTWLVAQMAGRLAAVPIPGQRLGEAALAALPVALIYFGLGLAVAAWRSPSWAAPFAGALALADFVYGIVGPLLDLPAWATRMSVFGRYGNPAIDGLSFSSHGVLLLVGVGLVLVALLGFQRRDLSW